MTIEDDLRYGDDELNGLCLHDEKKLKVCSRLSDDVRKGVLVHEATHALIRESGLEERIEEDQVEYFTVLMSNILHGFLKDNAETLYQTFKEKH